jgi:hypothetical protein
MKEFLNKVWQLLKGMVMPIITDANGQVSSLRVIMLLWFFVFIFLLGMFTRAFLFELKQTSINYTGLATLFTAIFINFALIVFSKVFQKKYEK